jgi:hypothetical protein
MVATQHGAELKEALFARTVGEWGQAIEMSHKRILEQIVLGECPSSELDIRIPFEKSLSAQRVRHA